MTADMGQNQQKEGFSEEVGLKNGLGMDPRGKRWGEGEDAAWCTAQKGLLPIVCHYQLGNYLKSLGKGFLL